jgi:hypothetical protein
MNVMDFLVQKNLDESLIDLFYIIGIESMKKKDFLGQKKLSNTLDHLNSLLELQCPPKKRDFLKKVDGVIIKPQKRIFMGF